MPLLLLSLPDPIPTIVYPPVDSLIDSPMVLIGATSLFIPAGRPFPNYETTLSTYPPLHHHLPSQYPRNPFSDGSLESARRYNSEY